MLDDNAPDRESREDPGRPNRPEWFGWVVLAGLLAVLAVVALVIGGPETPILWGMVSGVLLSLVIAAMTAFRARR